LARARLKVGERGEIGAWKIGDRKWQARCSYRDSYGKLRQLSATATTKAAATNALRDKWHNVVKKIITRHDGDETLTLDELATKYFDHLFEVRRIKKNNTETLPSRHKQYLNHLKPVIGDTLVIDCSAGMLTDVLNGIIEPDGSMLSVADKCRSIMVGMFQYAAAHNIIQHNPAENIPPVGYQAPRPRVWSDSAIYNIRLALRHWEDTPPEKTVPIADVFDLTLATACRISEVLAFRWEDLYLPDEDNKPGIVYVQKAVVRRTGVSNYLGAPKNGKKKRLTLPSYAVNILRRRKTESFHKGLVFTNRKGNAYSRDNLYRAAQRAFTLARQQLGIDVPDRLPFHTSRRTSLTEIAEVYGIEAASQQGGHSSLRVTERHYIQRDDMKIIDFSSALERFGKTAK